MAAKKKEEASVAVNRKVRHSYHVLETVECGIQLSGSEIKSVRMGNVSIKEAFGRIVGGVPFIYQMTIGTYPFARENHEPAHPRKLLLRKREIRQIHAEIKIKGRTWVPTRLYYVRGWLKVEMAICVGKKFHDKRHDLKKADAKREMDRAMRRG